MRVADKMAFTQVNRSISKNRSEMNELQNQAATQKRINKPSDDPMASARVLAARTDERGSQQFVKNINSAKSFLDYTDQSLSEVSEVLMRAKELAISQSSDAGANMQTRLTTAAEIEQLFNQAIQIGNRKFGERYIFGGTQTKLTPFTNLGDYKGDDGDIKVQIHKDTFLAMNTPGEHVFLGKGFGADGVNRPANKTPLDLNELREQKFEEQQRLEQNRLNEQESIPVRGLASTPSHSKALLPDGNVEGTGINIFKAIKDLEISLKSNDKEGIQDCLEHLDQAISQVVQVRSQVGARVSVLTNTMESLQKSIVDSRAIASDLEDADAFQVVSDINKTDSALRATLETSGKMIQPSLLDFLR